MSAAKMDMRALFAPLMLFAATPAAAHAFLEAATPPVGSTVRTAPTSITLTFSEAVEPRFSTVEAPGRVARRQTWPTCTQPPTTPTPSCSA